MTLITALIAGPACGYLFGPRRKAFAVWLAIWAVVLFVQTRFVVPKDNVDDWSYWPVQAAILVVAAVMIWLGARLRARRARAA